MEAIKNFLLSIINFFTTLTPKDSGKIKIYSVPKEGDKNSDVGILQTALNLYGANLIVDNDFGSKTLAALKAFQKSKNMSGTGIIPSDGGRTFEYLGLELVTKKLPWMSIARSMLGKKETDSAFNKEMSKKWSLFGMNLGTIAESWAAWCGLFIAVALSAAGIQYAKNGSLAKNWDKYAGTKIEWKTYGIPEGAIVRINHKADCKSESNNHVTFANGSCTASDVKSKTYFAGLGGNQQNSVRVSLFPMAHICSVTWPQGQTLPGKVLKSDHCDDGTYTPGESTR